MKQTPLKKLSLFVAAALVATACGVKGPPEPPLPTEASVKKTVTPPPTDPTPEQSSPIIFPVKEGKKKKDASKKQGP